MIIPNHLFFPWLFLQNPFFSRPKKSSLTFPDFPWLSLTMLKTPIFSLTFPDCTNPGLIDQQIQKRIFSKILDNFKLEMMAALEERLKHPINPPTLQQPPIQPFPMTMQQYPTTTSGMNMRNLQFGGALTFQNQNQNQHLKWPHQHWTHSLSWIFMAFVRKQNKRLSHISSRRFEYSKTLVSRLNRNMVNRKP